MKRDLMYLHWASITGEDYAVSSPEIVLAAAASVTKNIKLASAVTVLSSADPVKVYEDFATVDLYPKEEQRSWQVGKFYWIIPVMQYNRQPIMINSLKKAWPAAENKQRRNC